MEVVAWASYTYLEGRAPQPASSTTHLRATNVADPVPQFGAISAWIRVMSGVQEPVKLTGFGLNQMEPKYVQPANIPETAPLHHFGLNMMVPGWTSPLMREVNPVTIKKMGKVTSVTISRRESLTSVTLPAMPGPGATRVAARRIPDLLDEPREETTG